MATATTLNTVQILIKDGVIKISAPDEIITLDALKLDANWDSLTPAEQTVLTPIVNLDANKLHSDELSGSDLRVIASVRAKLNTTQPPAMVDVSPIAQPEPVKVEPKPITPILTSLEHHTATVTLPEGEEYTGGPKAKRKRKSDERMGAISKAVTARMRVVAFSDMERRILQLEKAREFFNEDIEELQYDIPSLIRAEIPEPTRVIRSVGGVMVTESMAMVKTKDLPLLRPYFDILDDYAEGTPNAIRLGCFTFYDHVEVSFKSREKLKGRVSRVADILLRSAHTSLINAIGKADDDLKKAMGNENLTLADMDKAQCGRDNLYRAAIRSAAEKLNVALMHCESYDTNMETKTLFKATYAAIDSIRAAFNAEVAKRDAKGVDV